MKLPTPSELKRLKIFFSGHLPAVLHRAAPICVQIVGPPVISAVSAITAGLWAAEASVPEQDQSVARAAGYEALLRGRELLSSIQDLDNTVNVAQGSENVNATSSVLRVGQDVVRALQNGRILTRPEGKESPMFYSSTGDEIALLDVERFVGWRSGVALSFCSKLANSLTLGEVIEAKRSVILLQQLLHGCRDIDAVVLGLPNAKDSKIVIMQQQWRFICGWLDSLFGTLKIDRRNDSNKKLMSDIEKVVEISIGIIDNNMSPPWEEFLFELQRSIKHETDILTSMISTISDDSNEDVLDNCITQFGLPILHLLSEFVQWASGAVPNHHSSSVPNNDHRSFSVVDRLWSMLMSTSGCWRLQGGSCLIGGKAGFDAMLWIRKEEAEDREISIQHEVRHSINLC